ncbi:hypothetical protein [Klebsiella pneumoniae]|uniref:hypothetical protein n=1 Tax=Klebsiella pneumoniae TaxID=573 RepID=UPI00320F3DF0
MDKLHFSSIMHMKEMNLRFITIADHSDELSATLVIHMMCEKIIETWIEASTNNKNFFSGGVNLTFKSKLQIAKNFSLPEECYNFMKTLNSIRNKFAHQIEKVKITENEMDDLYRSLSNYIKQHPNMDPKVCTLRTKNGTYNYSHSNNVRISFLHSLVILLLLEDLNLLSKETPPKL